MADRIYRKFKVVIGDRVVYCGTLRTAELLYDALNELLVEVQRSYPEFSISLLLAVAF